MTTRKSDVKVEKMVADRLDAYYSSKGWKTERVYDKERQVLGVDLVFFAGKAGLNFDEKAKYWGLQDGKKLDNYSFEVSRVCGDGERRVGWFADPRSLTDYYCWAFPVFEDAKNPTKGIKSGMQVELFAKKDVQAIVSEELPLENLYSLAEDMVLHDKKITPFKNFVLYKTPYERLEEEPVNVLIRRDLIMATPHFQTFTA